MNDKKEMCDIQVSDIYASNKNFFVSYKHMTDKWTNKWKILCEFKLKN
jgi:hypothetical protein